MEYLIVRNIHITCVALSFTLFLFRGGLMFADSSWLRNPVVKYAPHFVDTFLLTSALWLMSIVHQYPFVHAWLTAKLLLLLLYIVLGSFALKRGRTKRERGVFFLLAVLTFLFIVSVARAHSPWGILLPFAA